jgi:galactokinase
MSVAEDAIQAFEQRFGSRPKAAAVAPGRVEIMGNHTDYNGGYVLPAALDKATAVVGSPVSGDTITLCAVDFGREAVFSASDLVHDPKNTWGSYVLGVVQQLQRDGVPVTGFQAVIHSDVPGGAGLSSSAALEVATALFLQQLFPYECEPMEIARLCQRAENQFVGVQCGILDQFSSVFGRQDSLLFLDCLTLEHGTVKMGRSDIALVVCDSNVKHALTGGDYNTRRGECMAAAAHFGKLLLREIDWDDFLARERELPENQRRRARHVLGEDRRVLAMRQAVLEGDADRMRTIYTEAHASCRDLFENSTPEIDFLAATASALPGCFGAKLTGGGWGGCTVNLVQEDAVADFSKELTARYKKKMGREAHIYPCRASQGARAVEV